MTHPILNVKDVELQKWQQGESFEAGLGAISARLGAKMLGYNLTVLPPGKRAFPRHNHHVNEEMFFVIEGTGEVRIGDERYSITEGDVIACPPGGPETAHQIINTASEGDLRFLAVSTKLSPEIAEYPDSRKFGVLADLRPEPDGTARPFRFVSRQTDGLDYWEGEG